MSTPVRVTCPIYLFFPATNTPTPTDNTTNPEAPHSTISSTAEQLMRLRTKHNYPQDREDHAQLCSYKNITNIRTSE